MRKIIILAIIHCYFLIFSVESYSLSTYISSNSIVSIHLNQQKEIYPSTLSKKKMTWKARRFLKLDKKKNIRVISEEEQKKKIILMGKLSLWASIAAIVLVIVPLGFFLSILLVPTSFILGIISLKRRNKLTDKSGVKIGPALTGVIISSLALVFIIISTIYFSFFY